MSPPTPEAGWPPRNILVATDFSATARAALRAAAELARRAEGELHVAHSVRDPARMITGYEVLDEVLRGVTNPLRLQGEARGRLEAAAKEVGFPGAQLHALLGDPAAELVALRSIVGADLVVAGTGHIRGLRRLLLGSVADRLLRNPGPPLLLVRESPTEGGFRRILAGAERTGRLCRALASATSLARHVGAEVIALHVLPPVGYLSDENRVVIDPEREARKLTRTIEAYDRTVPGEVALRRGDPAEVIPDVAERLRADLVVVGAQRQPDGWPGRVTDRVARADIPAVLIVWPPPEES